MMTVVTTINLVGNRKVREWLSMVSGGSDVVVTECPGMVCVSLVFIGVNIS